MKFLILWEKVFGLMENLKKLKNFIWKASTIEKFNYNNMNALNTVKVYYNLALMKIILKITKNQKNI